jgi:hypothetical protein
VGNRFAQFCVRAATGAALSFVFPIVLSAQQDRTVYTGELRGDRSGCSDMNGAVAEISVEGDTVKGYRANARGRRENFEGKLTGSKFTASQTDSRGNVTSITGTVSADKIDLRVERSRCVYRAALKKK